MGEFFQGWRRKIGIVTLVLALVFTAGWVRSYSTFDAICIATGENSYQKVLSRGGSLGFSVTAGERGDFFIYNISVKAGRDDSEFEEWVFGHRGRFNFRWLGFQSAEVLIQKRFAHKIWFIPYWIIVTPFTLLSDFLILTKPRQSTPKRINGPIPETVA